MTEQNETEIVYTVKVTRSTGTGPDLMVKVSWPQVKRVLKEVQIGYLKGPEIDRAKRVTDGLLQILAHSPDLVQEWQVREQDP